MPFTVTAFGAVFLPVTLSVFLFRRAWLLPLMCVAAVLQAPSVLRFSLAGGEHGVTPFLAVALFAMLDLGLRMRRRKSLRPMGGEQRLVVRLWLSFGVVAVVSALLWPWLFAGLPVFSPLSKAGADGQTVALAWSLSNLAQAIYGGLLLALLLWLLEQRDDPELPRRMLAGIVIALLLSAAIGLQQRLAWNGLLPMGESFWASNPTYAQNFRSWAGPIPRVSWPFVEPSYASAWYAGVLGGCLALFLTRRNRHWALLAAVVAAFALGNSLGATGVITIALFLGLAVIGSLVWGLRVRAMRAVLLYQWALGSLVCACLVLVAYLVLRHYGMLEIASGALEKLLQGRNRTLWGDLRPHADRHALWLLLETWGLGVGMGSNRGSSYLLATAAGTGLLGVTLLLAAFSLQTRLLLRRLRQSMDAPTVFFFGAGLAAMMAASIAIPDQNWPVLWMLLWGGVACLSATRPPAKVESDEPNHHGVRVPDGVADG